jgi:hypothetical protein
MLHITRSDLPIDITIFDAARHVIAKEAGKRSATLTLPRGEISFIEISGAHATRYRLTLRLEVDPAHLPGPHEKGAAVFIPDLGDPPFRVDDGMSHVIFHADVDRRADTLTFAAVEGQPLKVELLNNSGEVIRNAQRRENSIQESVEINVGDLASGAHVLRIGHADAQLGLSTTPLNVQLLPSFA